MRLNARAFSILLLHCFCLPKYHLAQAQDVGSAISTTDPSVFDETFKARFTDLFDIEFMELMVDCSQLAPECDIRSLVEVILETSEYMLKLLEQFPTGYPYPFQRCEAWFEAMVTNPVELRNDCADRNQWPSQCLDFGRGLEERANDGSWELPVVCSLVAPGEQLERLPTCKQLVDLTIANQPSLHDHGCNFDAEPLLRANPGLTRRDICLSNFCGTYEQFAWRMKPRNLQDVADEVIFSPDFVLPGCEVLEQYNLAEDCHRRVDVLGFCDCLCPGMADIATNGYANCPSSIDAYIMFGRLGVANVTFEKDCESELCRIFNERRLAPACENQNLPSEHECLAIQLPQVAPGGEICPWKNHSHEDDVMVCLDGYRCNVQDEGWYCCEMHRGRAMCPANLPVMCDTLCSGITEYCCRQEGECTPRTCPVPIDNIVVYEAYWTANTTTVAEFVEAKEDEGFVFILPQGWWISLFFFAPCLCGLVFLILLRRRQVPPDDGTEGLPETMEMKNDKFGIFHVFNPEQKDSVDPAKPRVCIMMPELPANRPLGLELMELRVIRVHDWGRQYGWQVGDIIVDIGGQAVTTFEELWERIQVERNRPPVRFTVERWNILNTEQEEEAADVGSPKAPRGLNKIKSKSQSASDSKTLRQVARENNMFLPNAVGKNSLPSAAHGWDYEWDDRYDEDGYYDEDDYTEDYAESHQGGSIADRRGESDYPGYKSRFSATFEVIKKKEKVPEALEDKDKGEEGEEDQDALAATHLEKAMGAKQKVKLAEEEAKGKSFKQNRVVFARDAWGRSVLQVQS